MKPLIPDNDKERVESLRELGLLDTPAEERFDAISRLAADICSTPIAYISLVDEERQFLKSAVGMPRCETRRDQSFCGYAILEEEILVVPDTHADPRFRENPMVTGDPHARFYAGQPLRSKEGLNIATLCLMDTNPREFGDEERDRLKHLALIVERELHLGNLLQLQHDLIQTKDQLISAQEEVAKQLDEALAYVVSILPEELDGVLTAKHQFVPSSALGGDAFGYQWIDENRFAVYLLDVCGHGVGSALLSVSAINTLNTRSLPGVDFGDPLAVVTAMNRAYPMEKHNGLYFTFWYGVIDIAAERLSYAGAGHPPAALCDPDGSIQSLSTVGLPVGCLDQCSYTADEVSFPKGSQLYVFSDGIYEIPKEDGSFGTYAEFLSLLKMKPTPEEAVRQARVRMNADGFPDDVSILSIASL